MQPNGKALLPALHPSKRNLRGRRYCVRGERGYIRIETLYLRFHCELGYMSYRPLVYGPSYISYEYCWS